MINPPTHDQAGLIIGGLLLAILILLILLKWLIIQKRKSDAEYQRWEQEVDNHIKNNLKS